LLLLLEMGVPLALNAFNRGDVFLEALKCPVVFDDLKISISVLALFVVK
jgi:hypothetical protein